jgi:hypothetical protein
MKHLIKNPRDFWAGVMFLTLGAMFAGVGVTYKIGTAARMGPGYFPVVLGVILVALGLAIAVSALRKEGASVEKFHWRPIFWVLGSIIMFGVLLKILGMLLAGFLQVVISSYGGPEFKVRAAILLALALVIFCALVFVVGLKLPIPMCPGLDFFEQFQLCRV